VAEGGYRGLGGGFARLATAFGVSSAGDGVRLVALPLLAATFTTNPLLITALVVANRVPWILFALSGGWIADRFGRRAIMVLIDAVRAAIVATFAVCVACGAGSLWLIAIVSFALGVGETIYAAANQGMVPDIVAPDNLVHANGLTSMLQSVASNFVGPACGGFLFSAGRYLPFLVDAVSFVAASALVSTLPVPVRGPAVQAGGMLASIRAGMAWALTRRLVVTLLLVMTVMNLAQAAMQAVLVLYATRTLGLSAMWYGAIMSVAGAGAVLGGLTAPGFAQRFGIQRIMRPAVAVAVPIMAVLWAVRSPWVLGAALFVNSFAGLMVTVLAAVIRQRVVPRELAGRVASVQLFAAIGVALPLGSLLGGAVATAFGVPAVFGFALLVCLALTVGTWSRLAPRRLLADVVAFESA
jgi:MFS family permease